MMSRREWLGTTAAALAAGAIGAVHASAREPATTQAATSRLKLRPFGYGDVTLTGGPLKEQFDHALGVYLKLDDDRILKVYREAAGLPAPGEPMGGWYDPGAFAPGHAFGQWLSALSRFAAAGSTDAAAKVARLVDGFDATLKAGDKSFYDGHRFKAYVFDKHVIGLTDAFRYARVDVARDVLGRATDAAVKYLPEKALTREEMRARPHMDITYTWDESYTLPENLFIAHEVLGDDRFLELAKRYLHDEPYFDKLARGEPAMVGQHAYSHVNALSSAAMAFLSLGSQKHLDAARNAWDMIVRDQRYASGGWGPNEDFPPPHQGKLFDSLAATHNHFETGCGSYATFKIARYLTGITGESRYGDDLERVLYNCILAAKRIRGDGANFYYSDYSDFARKTYHPDKWTCCSGTYPQAVVDYLISAYFRGEGEDDVFVNLYVPSELRWTSARGEVKITQTTEYPESDRVTLRVDPAAPAEFAVHLRIPPWAGTRATISVNGTAQPVPAAGGFAPVRRRWQPGDTIQLMLPLDYRAEPIDAQHPKAVALMRGPVMHVAVGDRPKLRPLDAGGSAPALDADFASVPFYKVDGQAYTTYVSRT